MTDYDWDDPEDECEGAPGEDEGRSDPCDYCTCCTRLGCYRGDHSDCPVASDGLTYNCPCTGE